MRKLLAWILQKDVKGVVIAVPDKDGQIDRGWIYGTNWHINIPFRKL